MIKPVSPYITDAVAHIFYYTQHMATVHYEDGKLHVHKEVIDEAKKTQSQSESPASKKDNSTADHISTTYKNITGPFFNPFTYFPCSTVLTHDNFSYGDFPPPRI